MRALALTPRVSLLLGAMFLLSGCALGGDDGPVVEEEEEVPVAGVPKVIDLGGAPEVYSYSSIGKRDPFRSFIQKEVVVSHDGGVLGPLQIHEVDSYTLTGIIANPSAPYALVKDPDGIGHVVELGTLVGRNWGKVTEIKPEEIVITEEYRDPIENELIIHEVKMAFEESSSN